MDAGARPQADGREQTALAAMFASSPAIVAVLSGPDHVLVEANRALYRAHGTADADTLPGRPVGDTLPELVHQGMLGLLDQVYRTGAPVVVHGAHVLLGRGPTAHEGYFDFTLEAHRDPLGGITGVICTAVDVTRERRARQLAAEQHALLEQIARNVPLGEVLEGMCRTIEGLSPRVLVSVLLIDENGHQLRHGAAPSLPDFYNQAIDGSEIGPCVGSCGTAAYRRAGVIVTDIAHDELWTDFRELARTARLGACWSNPIMSTTGELLGTFAFYHRTPRTPREEDLDLCAVFARTAALAIERDRAETARREAHAREQAAAADLAFVLETSTAVSREPRYPQNLQRLARLAVPALAPVCLIDVLADGHISRVAVAVSDDLPEGTEAALAAQPPDLRADSPVSRVMAGGVREIDHGAWPRPVPALPCTVTGYVCVPLTVRGRTFGTLTLVATTDKPLDARAVALAEELARTAAAGADTTRQYAHRAQLARDLQSGLLLSALPDVPGAHLCACYRPAGEGLDIGGDFYDVFPLPGRRWGLVIGDVCGRGARAATTTALVRHTARAVAPLLSDPVAVVRAINDALLGQPDGEERFVTLVYAALEPAPAGLSACLVRAGHPSPLLRRGDGSVTVSLAPGQLLGVAADPVQTAETVLLLSGEAIVLVTDGILEARDRSGAFFGEERLVEAVRSGGAAASARRTLEAITGAVDAFSYGATDDDQAAVVLTVR
ncbi:SpoIIE family protein phosphatase [Streptacidiphilus griseoplanus]|uniref:SpoIIE family protein phosphatase n=1 Tax=Peterkaempfera griseoplana TaxID=66896 RepID=UPI001FE06766|nr:SpoIIE family protein phosphatase [Peterkaempfera griseoplana]